MEWSGVVSVGMEGVKDRIPPDHVDRSHKSEFSPPSPLTGRHLGSLDDSGLQ